VSHGAVVESMLLLIYINDVVKHVKYYKIKICISGINTNEKIKSKKKK
jgi:hypothetical protein